jgi:hypothetical protein
MGTFSKSRDIIFSLPGANLQQLSRSETLHVLRGPERSDTTECDVPVGVEDDFGGRDSVEFGKAVTCCQEANPLIAGAEHTTALVALRCVTASDDHVQMGYDGGAERLALNLA